MKTVVLFVCALAGCAPVTPLPGVPRGKCSADHLGILVGRNASPALVERARHRAGASMVRVLRPGQAATMDYRSGRLNVNVDGRNRVQRFTCG